MLKPPSSYQVSLVLLLSCMGSLPAQYPRRTAIVEAVEKTREGIVTLKVLRDRGLGKREIVATGVIIEESGYALTNYHVIQGASKITVVLADRTRVEPTVHSTSPRHDLAILKLPSKKKLKALTVSSGSDLMVGEHVIAVGHPFGFENTVSTGIISALNREISGVEDEPLTGLIQHSASINPGNSGGPLLNINGELIGINVALREGAQNISFAINAETIKSFLAQHLSAGKIAKVEHGLCCTEMVASEGDARQKVIIDRVLPLGAAAQAGFKKGDVLLRVGSLVLQNRFDVERAFWNCKPGDKVSAVVLRQGRQTTLDLTLTGVESGLRTAHSVREAR